MQNFLDKFVTTCTDDITIFSDSFEQHLEHLGKALERPCEVNMTIKPSKCAIARKEVEGLGFLVSESGIKPASGNVQRIVDCLKPQNKSVVRAFISL